MRIVIFGAGIAGLAAGIRLKRLGHSVHVYEQAPQMNDQGNAFLMHDDGLDILRDLGDEARFDQMGENITHFKLNAHEGEEVKSIRLRPWRCFKRNQVIRYLYDAFGEDHITHNASFEKFEWKDGLAKTAFLSNGQKIEADFFIGADGIHSKVREKAVFQVEFSPVFTYELLGFIQNPELYKQLKTKFIKYQHRTKSIACGVLPAAKNELITVLQFDPALIRQADIDDTDHAKISSFLLQGFPKELQDLMSHQTFDQTYIWKTRDFDLIPCFHNKNVVVIGDAAHVALPFSSSGTTNALLDAESLAHLVFSNEKITSTPAKMERALKEFYRKRSKEVDHQIRFGRELKDKFLMPSKHPLENQRVPLVFRQPDKEVRPPKHRYLRVLYFTDPICSTCWAIQPQLRKLELEFGNQIQIQHRMGGLLPHWKGYNRFGISQPLDVAEHWDEVEAWSGMPMNGDIWRHNPLPSSYPPSIAFKAAQIQSAKKAIIFLRRIREVLFVGQQNILNIRVLYDLALQSGLDAAQFLRDIPDLASERFNDDLDLKDSYEVKILPTMIFENHTGEVRRIEGYREYDKYVQVIRELNPNLKVNAYSTSGRELFDRFPSMSLKEFMYLSNQTEEDALNELKELQQHEAIEIWETPRMKLYLSTLKLQQGFV